jgi:hypothetical protein
MTDKQKVINEEIEAEILLIKRERRRSPNYPIYNLEKTLQYAEKLRKANLPPPIPILSLHTVWEFEQKSGHILQVVAALVSYGLAETEGNKEQRKIRISELGAKIIRNVPDKMELLQKAALRPAIFKAIWDKYQGLPTEDELEHELEFGSNLVFKIENQRARRVIVKNFSETVKFAKLDSSDRIDASNLGGESMHTYNITDTQDSETLRPTEPANLLQEFFILNSKVGSLRISYPMTKEKVEIIEKFVRAEKAESNLPIEEELIKDSKT